MQEVVADLNAKAVIVANTQQARAFMIAYKTIITKHQLDFEDDAHFAEMDIQSRTVGCGCWLCKLRFEYTQRKKEMHRIYKRVTNDEFVYMTGSCANSNYAENQEIEAKKDWEYYYKLKIELELIAQAKTKIKEALGYDKHEKSTRVSEEVSLSQWEIQNLLPDGLLESGYNQ